MKSTWILYAILLVPHVAIATIVTDVNLLDPTDGVFLPPPGITCIDVIAITPNTAGHAWTASGLRGRVTPEGIDLGVSILYAPGDDPNTPHYENLVNPGTENRFTTFLSRPRPRDGAARYTNGQAAPAGRYEPTGPIETVEPHAVNVAWFPSPPPSAQTIGVDGWIARIALDTSGISTPIGIGRSLSELPYRATLIFASDPRFHEGQPHGTVSASFDDPTPSGLNWYVWALWVPEPSTVMLLLISAVPALRRRPRFAASS